MFVKKISSIFVFAASVMMLMSVSADASIITFTGLSHGEIVTNQIPGVTISADNFISTNNEAIIFDSNLTGTADPDLEFSGGWAGGNIQNTALGNMLIIAENLIDNDGNGLVDNPDDQGSPAGSPAGEITFAFAQALNAFSFNFVDVDNNGVSEDPSSYMLSFYLNNQLQGSKTFAEFPGITHGHNFANSYPVITSGDVGGDFDEVVVLFGGSGAIDNIYYQTSVVPEPATMFLFGSGLIGAYARKRKRS